MSPIRLVIIAALIYLGYRLLISDWRRKRGKNEQSSDTGSATEDNSVADVLVEDPVCHKLVPKQQAIRLKQKGNKDYYYFCSEECCDKFVGQTGEQK